MKRYNMILIIFTSLLIKICSTQEDEPREINPFGTCSSTKCKRTDPSGSTTWYFSGHVIENHLYAGSSLSDIVANETECVKECINVPICNAVMVSSEQNKCFLYEGDDIYANPELILPMDGFKIISLGNGACGEQPCNNGTCVPDYDTGSYSCKCHPGYGGERCDGPPTPELQFHFDQLPLLATSKTIEDITIQLDQGKLVSSPERRGKALYAGEGKNAVKIKVGPKAAKEGKWMSNFLNGDGKPENLTLTLWLKMGPKIRDDVFRKFIDLKAFSLGYNGKKKMVKAFVGSKDNEDGSDDSFNPSCIIENISRWTHIAFAGCGSSVKLFVNGLLCDEKSVADVEPLPVWELGADDFKLLADNGGATLIDEIKFFNYFPEDDEFVLAGYEMEKKRHMY